MSHDSTAHSTLPLHSTPVSMLVRTGGALGIAGSLIGVAIFVTACAGFDAVFYFSMIPFAMGIVGLLVLACGAIRRGAPNSEPAVLAALFINLMAIIGGLLEIAVWMRWPLFFGQAA